MLGCIPVKKKKKKSPPVSFDGPPVGFVEKAHPVSVIGLYIGKKNPTSN